MEQSLIKQVKEFFEKQSSELKYPMHLANEYPRILNKIYHLWNNPKECDAYLEELVLNSRDQKRSGFKFEVLMELDDIKSFYEKSKHIKVDPWEDPNYFKNDIKDGKM